MLFGSLFISNFYWNFFTRTVFDMINAVYQEKPLILIKAKPREKLFTHAKNEDKGIIMERKVAIDDPTF